MAKKADAKSTAETPRRRVADPESPPLRASAPLRLKSSALVDTRVIYCGDNLEQLRRLPDACVDLDYRDAMKQKRTMPLVFLSLALLFCPVREACAQLTLINVGHTTNYPSGSAGNVVVSGNYAYLANGDDGLRIYDISAPSNPLNVGHVLNTNLGPVLCVAVSGNYAYVVQDFSPQPKLLIYDISNPANPTNVGSTNCYGQVVRVSGQYAYTARGIYDVSAPTNPVVVATFDHWAFGLAISGNYAYLATGPDGMRIYDVSNPTNPINVGYVPDYNGSFGYGQAVTVSGHYAYLANQSDGLRIYDVSNPAIPNNVGYANNGQFVFDVTVSGNYAYLSKYSNGMDVYDVSSPASPTMVAHVNEGTNNPGSAKNVAVSGNYIYLDNWLGLRIYSLAGPTLSLAWTTTNTAVLAWPGPAPGFLLQENPALGASNWTNVSNAVSVVGSVNQVVVWPSPGPKFYRLFHP